MKDFSKFQPDREIAEYLLDAFTIQNADQVHEQTVQIIEQCRLNKSERSLLDQFLSEYGLTNHEGVALMCLAESILRIPDTATKDQLIEEKLTNSNWANHLNQADSLFVNAATWGLLIAGKVITPPNKVFDNPLEWLQDLSKKMGEGSVRRAITLAMQILSKEFVMGVDFDSVLKQGNLKSAVHSFDMLGEAARSKQQSQNFFNAYYQAIEEVGKLNAVNEINHGVSIKLSALHPRFETLKYKYVKAELFESVSALANLAQSQNVEITIDAEEQHRLSISLDLIETLALHKNFKDWDGLGLAVQAYGKRGLNVFHFAKNLAHTRAPLHVRLTKGAYWDGEIKAAQVAGLSGFPVLINKDLTDLNYLFIASKLLTTKNIHPRFATHNAHTITSIHHMAEDADYEFQRLFGMGEMLYAKASKVLSGMQNTGVYAPIGPYKELLPYLVRRLLENGANSSFVNSLLDPTVPPSTLAEHPNQKVIAAINNLQHKKIVSPHNLFPQRKNSAGFDLSEPENLNTLQQNFKEFKDSKITAITHATATTKTLEVKKCVSIADGHPLGTVNIDDLSIINEDYLVTPSPSWKNLALKDKQTIFFNIADQLEAQRDKIIYFLIHEAGKTYKDAIDEIREAVDFLRYYAVQAEKISQVRQSLPGPTGETNDLFYEPKGIFVCISPWNFPVAIFIGQIAAALITGNSVLAKPSEHTPLLGEIVADIFYDCGIPTDALQLFHGNGEVGQKLISCSGINGVAFTGSLETAKKIHQQLSHKAGPIANLIAETGGLNAMIIDSSSLLEQVVDDILRSAFNSAGQRCSALRIALIHETIYEDLLNLLRDAMKELWVGSPEEFHCDVGPIIEDRAMTRLENYLQQFQDRKFPVFSHNQAPNSGCFIAPTLIELSSLDEIDHEMFGPILHTLPFQVDNLDNMLSQLVQKGYGLTMGMHSRIEGKVDDLLQKSITGNVYINRDIVGAVVGSQPFGGTGLSGTGFKAGGPNYLLQFVDERTVTKNTVAFGGNTDILNLD